MGLILQIINGLQLGSIYALVALGYTMVYGIALLINFAHGEIIMIGAYTTVLAIQYALLNMGLPFYLAIIPSIIVCTIFGVLIERLAYKPLRNSPRIANLITAIGVSLLLQNSVMKIFGATAKPVPPIFEGTAISTANFTISKTSLYTILITLILTVLLQLFMKKTKYGKAMVATSEDYAAAELVGINVDNTLTMTFAIGSALAGVAAVLYVSAYPQVDPFMGSTLGIKAFTAAVVGGIGLIPGAVLGGLILGIIEALTKAYISSKLTNAIVFGLLIVVLLVKPTGLLGKNLKEKV
ncbi:branched-chain amino acid ABC transporter permease [Anaerosphaera multitolerans]|uniref:Branched-chain amino acid ABC transporter permease n=1 Tax=Anaerosphaera multitolerans TaxID=2487351 RepID=A0A437S6W7_9FIRM|nr:branched-chain amino acid ABC transporter permease [Anaerosphaera multitolerans]RVU54744.1 branched-chain amino acid ABC transporter permease [Anaerosphaera multitolerans]